MRYLIILIGLLITITGCEKAFIEKDPENNPVEVFDELWHTLDKKYSFFAYKNIDWDSVYNHYSPLVHKEMTEEELFNVCSDVLYSLKDGHVNLYAPFDFTRNWSWSLYYPENFDYSLLERNYLKEDYRITGSLRNKAIREVGYIYYGSFMSGVEERDIDYVLEQFKDLPGIIFDIRGNSGGRLSNARTLASRFTGEKLRVGYKMYKKGPEHNDFSKKLSINQKPEGDYQFTKPVVLLTNRSSYSAANEFTLRMKALPHVTVIGDKTGGGGGLPIYAELPNGWRYRFSSTMTFDTNGNNIEHGIDPDIKVDMDSVDIHKGKDTILEEAIAFIKSREK